MGPLAEDAESAPGNSEDPFADPGTGATNLFGAFSAEQFAAVGALSQAHGDAGGFLAYPEQFAPRSFWYRDAGVKAWAFRDDFDDWEDTYGLDAVRVAYHSGHGATSADGVFRVPMGAVWRGRDATATSDDMRIGDGHARYVFWSCSASLRITDGHNPFRTWAAANAGVRMMFGFDDQAFDSPHYGTHFWRHWRGGEPLSAAWLNACWDVAEDQTPVVLACGRDRDEAVSRLDCEHHFGAAPADTAWWQWRWYTCGARPAREPNTTAPRHPKRAVLAPLSARRAADLGEQFDAGGSDRRLYVNDGMVTLHLDGTGHVGDKRLSRAAAVSAGGEAIRRYGLEADGPLVLDRVVEVQEAGASRDSGVHEDARTVAAIVQYRQFVNGIPILSSGAGLVRVWVGNDGVVTKIQTSTRAVVTLVDSPGPTTAEPGVDGEGAAEPEGATYDAKLSAALGHHLRQALARGGHPLGYRVLPGTREVGYHIHGDAADLFASQAVELEFESGYRSRIWVRTPLSG